jgi:phosphoribosyl 1,2-cyclic phosphodiesterase
VKVWSIASGSSGNAYLVQSEGATLLVECGIPLSRIARFLRGLGIAPHHLDGVLLTHDHSDHTRSARQLSDTYRVPIYATIGTLRSPSLRDA